jgi:aromatic ring hydroxylase
MPLKTGEQFVDSLRALNMRVYMFGERVENVVDNPTLRPSLNSMKATYDLAQDPLHAELMTVVSPHTGERVNRFAHIHRSADGYQTESLHGAGSPQAQRVMIGRLADLEAKKALAKRIARIAD